MNETASNTAKPAGPEWSLTVRAVAGALGLSESTVRRWGDDGAIPCRRVAHRNQERRYRQSDVDALLRASAVAA